MLMRNIIILIMKRSELERKYYKNSSPENNKAYRKQKNSVVNFTKRKEKNIIQTWISKILQITKSFGKL